MRFTEDCHQLRRNRYISRKRKKVRLDFPKAKRKVRQEHEIKKKYAVLTRSPTDHFLVLELQNPSSGVSQLHKVRVSPD